MKQFSFLRQLSPSEPATARDAGVLPSVRCASNVSRVEEVDTLLTQLKGAPVTLTTRSLMSGMTVIYTTREGIGGGDTD